MTIMTITPFTFLVNATVVKEAARRAELLDLPRRRSPKFDLARRERLAEVKSAEDVELDSILDEMESGTEADVDFLLSRLDGEDGESSENVLSEDGDVAFLAEDDVIPGEGLEEASETEIAPELVAIRPEMASAAV